jgi:hypothetical protein
MPGRAFEQRAINFLHSSGREGLILRGFWELADL